MAASQLVIYGIEGSFLFDETHLSSLRAMLSAAALPLEDAPWVRYCSLLSFHSVVLISLCGRLQLLSSHPWWVPRFIRLAGTKTFSSWKKFSSHSLQVPKWKHLSREAGLRRVIHILNSLKLFFFLTFQVHDLYHKMLQKIRYRNRECEKNYQGSNQL